jgi:ankyrin repeat protein
VQWYSPWVLELIVEEIQAVVLQNAISESDFARVEYLLERGVDVNVRGGYFGFALQAAAASPVRHLPIAELLLYYGADVHVLGGPYGTALQAASMGGRPSMGGRSSMGCISLPMIRLLLNYGAGNTINVQGGKYGTALQAAIFANSLDSNASVQLLLDNGSDVNISGGIHGGSLPAAPRAHSMEVVSLLLNHGADPNIRTPEGTALGMAVADDNKNLVQLLLDHGADPDVLQVQVRVRVPQPFMAFGVRTEVSGTALQLAAHNGRTDIVRLLLDRGAKSTINLSIGSCGTPLHAAATRRSLSIIGLLLDKGADANAKGGLFGTALTAAVGGSTIGVVRLLLAHGADPDLSVDGCEYPSALELARRINSLPGRPHTSEYILQLLEQSNLRSVPLAAAPEITEMEIDEDYSRLPSTEEENENWTRSREIMDVRNLCD